MLIAVKTCICARYKGFGLARQGQMGLRDQNLAGLDVPTHRVHDLNKDGLDSLRCLKDRCVIERGQPGGADSVSDFRRQQNDHDTILNGSNLRRAG